MIYDDKLVDTDFNKVIGDVLKEKRINKGWSLLELSKRMKNKVSRQTLFHYENGETKIRRNIFIEICKVYNIDPDSLIDEITIKYMRNK
jgi:transcriptional regulator with XRE-family HTH domain